MRGQPVATRHCAGTRRRVRWPVGCLLMLAVCAAARATEPPPLLNYVGVLRDPATGDSLDGTFDMVARFYDAGTAGNEILRDRHEGANAIVVTGGLFTIQLGGGVVEDGTGPGIFLSLAEVVGSYTSVWLELQVAAEVLTPRIPVLSAASALNAGRLDGKDSSEFIDTSPITQTKQGDLNVNGAVAIDGALLANQDVQVTGTVELDGPLLIKPGAADGKVLISDALGAATWRDPPAGMEGPQGPPGVPGADELAGYEVMRVEEDPFTVETVWATCSPGKAILGGACLCHGDPAVDPGSPGFPELDGGHSWRCNCGSVTGQTPPLPPNIAWAFCAEPQPFCGDGIRTGDEQCDGADDGGCLTACVACKCDTCGNTTCDSGTVHPVTGLRLAGESCQSCPADCGACAADAPVYTACDDITTFCAAPYQCVDGVCTAACWPTSDPNDVECDLVASFDELCMFDSAGTGAWCRASCLDQGGMDTCPNDLVCATATQPGNRWCVHP